MNEQLLRKFILEFLLEKKKAKEVLGEPDQSAEEERYDDEEEDSYDEQNVVANLGGGPVTPLGTGPSGKKSQASKNRKAKKKVIDIAKRNFGGAE